MIPAYAAGILAVALTTLAYRAEDRYWVARDHLLEITPEAPGICRYQYKLAQAMRQEFIEILNDQPPSR